MFSVCITDYVNFLTVNFVSIKCHALCLDFDCKYYIYFFFNVYIFLMLAYLYL